MKLALVFPLLAMLSLPCMAEPPSKAEAALQAISEKFPGFTVKNMIVFGDINSDGVDDFVALVDDAKGQRRMAVFFGKPGSGYIFHDISGDTFAHSRVYDEVEIIKTSVFLHRDGSGGCCSHWSEDFQFKLRDGKLVLIGLETSTSSVADEQTPESNSGISANLITGDVVRWRTSETNRTEQKSKIAKRKLVTFKDFNYEGFSSQYAGELW